MKKTASEFFVFDLKRHAISFFLCDRTDPSKVTILKAGEAVVDCEAPADEKIAALKKVLGDYDAKSRLPAILTSNFNVSFKQLVFPFLPAADLQKAFLWDMKNQYGFDPDETLLASKKTTIKGMREADTQNYFHVFCMDRGWAMAQAALFESMGFKVIRLLPGQAVTAAWLAATTQSTSDRDVLTVDIGHSSAWIGVVRGDANVFSRSVLLGGQTLTEMMTVPYMDAEGKKQLGLKEAESLKLSQGASDPRAAHICLLRPYLEKLRSEIKRSVDFYESQKNSKPIGRVVFSGGGSDLKGLTEYMRQFLGMEIGHVTPEEALFSFPSDSVKKQVAERAGFFSGALGAAVSTPPSINFLPQDAVKATRPVQAAFSRMLFVFVCAGMVFLILWSYAKSWSMQLELRSLGTLTSESQRVNQLVAEAMAHRKIEESLMAGDLPHAALLKEIASVTPESIRLDSIEYARPAGAFIVRGSVLPGKNSAADMRVLASYVQALMKSNFFKDANVSTPDTSTDGARPFEIRVKSKTAGGL